MPGPTHYEVLGVARSASSAEVRRAYLDRARALHPDRNPAAARAMQDVNEAWRVLRDPAARSAYDDRLRGVGPPSSVAAPPRRRFPTDAEPDAPFWPPVPGHHGPVDTGARVVRSLPWIAGAIVLAAIFVFTAFAGGGSSTGRTSEEEDMRSASDLVDRCVSSQRAGQLEVVGCGEEGAERVDLIALRASACPSGSSALPYGDTWLCLRPADEGSGRSAP